MDKVICSLSGTEPSQWCKGERTEIFAADQGPLPASQDLRREVQAGHLDGSGGLRCLRRGLRDDVVVINVKDEWARKWFETRDGRDWLRDNGFDSPPVYAPERECSNSDPQATLEINVQRGQVISQPVLPLQGTMDATGGFKSWLLEFGLGDNPDGWTTLAEGKQPVQERAAVQLGPVQPLQPDDHPSSLYEGDDGYAEKTVHFSARPAPRRRRRRRPRRPHPTETLASASAADRDTLRRHAPSETPTP